MKQCTLKFPQAKAGEIAKFCAENGIINNCSYSVGDDFFSKHVVMIICFPEDKEDKVKANLQKFIQA